MYALILAGGTGTRLWPLSRRNSPKQLMPLIGKSTMVQATVKRIAPIIAKEHVFFATNAEYGAIIEKQLPDVPRQNIVIEPSAKNTAPCIGLAALHMERLDSSEVMASLHADHFIADEEGFRQALLAAEEVARQGYLVTLGIQPDKPETGYGYVHQGRKLGTFNGFEAFEVQQFLEKPDLETAEKFLARGTYYWNSGIFIWQISALMTAFQQHLPEFYQQVGQLREALDKGVAIDTIWQAIKPVSIDVGIMERAKKVAMIPVDIGWNDVGSWAATYEVGDRDENDNVVVGDHILTIDTSGSLIQGNDRFIATVGLQDVVVVDTGDALLVCAKDRAQDVKQVVTWLEEQQREDLL